jgi:hypothetical protein
MHTFRVTVLLESYYLSGCGSRSGIRCLTSGPGIRDGKKPGSGSGILIRDELGTNFWVKIIEFFDVYLGSGMEKIWIRNIVTYKSYLN